MGATQYRRIPSLHAPPGAAAFYVSAHLTLKGCHSSRSRPAMATGRPLVISLARYAAPIRQYSVFPQSAPWPLERSLQGQPRKAFLRFAPRLHTYPRIVGRFHKGGDLSWLPRKVRVAKPLTGLEPATLQSPIFWAALPTELQGHRVPHSRGSGFRHHPICCVKEVKNEIR